MRACEDSLRRLKTDRIDLFQMHHVDRDSPWEEIWQAMDTLVAQGKVIYVGSSNFAGWHIARANEQARRRHSLGLVAEQSLYNLIDRGRSSWRCIPACEGYGLGLIPWSPLKGGVLGGALKKASEGRRAADSQAQAIEKHRPKLERYEAMCERIGQPPGEVALAWVLANPVVTAPIIGPRTAEQLDSAMRALELTLDAAVLKELDDIFPGPGGAAPEAYAW